jgi:UDP-N-acetylmuramoylalanine--D-glutamate ligase
MAAYKAAKARVFGQQALMVINRDDPLVEALVPAPVRSSRASSSRSNARSSASAWTRRAGPGDFGLVVENGMAWLVRALPTEEGLKRRKGEATKRSTCST